MSIDLDSAGSLLDWIEFNLMNLRKWEVNLWYLCMITSGSKSGLFMRRRANFFAFCNIGHVVRRRRRRRWWWDCEIVRRKIESHETLFLPQAKIQEKRWKELERATSIIMLNLIANLNWIPPSCLQEWDCGAWLSVSGCKLQTSGQFLLSAANLMWLQGWTMVKTVEIVSGQCNALRLN